MPDPKFSFKLKPKEAIKYLEGKGFKQSFNYQEIMHEAHHRSFTVAKVMRDDLLADIHTSLIDAQDKGIGFKEWKKNIKPTLLSYGWYGKTDVVDPRTGEVKTIHVGSKRLRTIFGTNMRVSHAVARYKKLKALPFSSYWMYVSMLLPNTRDEHAAMHETVLPRDHAWWKTNYPPNGWNCYCKVRAYAKKELERRGIKVAANAQDIASPDWAYNVGESNPSTLKKLRKERVLQMPKKIKKAALSSIKIDEVFYDSYKNASMPLQSYILTKKPTHKIISTIKHPAIYDAKTKTIILKAEEIDPIIYRHELGHHIDNINDFLSVAAITKSLKVDELIWRQNKNIEDIKKLAANTQEDAAIHDVIYLASKRKYGVQTRDDQYKITPGVTAKEIFANIFEMILTNDDRLDTIRKYFPTTVGAVEKILKEVAGDR